MLPANFWEEFDRRLDSKLDKRFTEFETRFEQKLEAKLEAKLEDKLEPIRKNITKLINWTQRQDESIEREMTYAMKSHLQEHYKGYITIEPKIFPKDIKRPDGTILTEFDGIMILTNFPDYYKIVVPDKDKSNAAAVAIPKDVELFIIIVEAKQHLTSAKVTKKIAQKESIERYIRDVHAGVQQTDRALQRVMIERFKPTVGMYIGGVDVDFSVKKNMTDYAKTNPMCGIIDLNGARFSVKDASNDFGDTQFGGKKKHPNTMK
jgi:hypothetical protein